MGPTPHGNRVPDPVVSLGDCASGSLDLSLHICKMNRFEPHDLFKASSSSITGMTSKFYPNPAVV